MVYASYTLVQEIKNILQTLSDRTIYLNSIRFYYSILEFYTEQAFYF